MPRCNGWQLQQLQQQPTSSLKKAGRHLKVGVMALQPTNSSVSKVTLYNFVLRPDTMLKTAVKCNFSVLGGAETTQD